MFRHTVKVRGHELSVDERAEVGGDGHGARARSSCWRSALASCTAVTMEMYAQRKGWDVGGVEVTCDYTPAERGCPTRFNLVMRFPEDLTEDQVERLRIIAAKCPVHRTLDGEVMFDERVERVTLAA